MTLKRILRPVVILLAAAFLWPGASFGQIPIRTHDVSLQFGLLSVDQTADIVNDLLTVVLSIGTFAKRDPKFTGVPFLTYHYSANSRFGFGGAIGGFSSSGVLEADGIESGTFRERNYVAAAELDYHWIMREALQVYSGAGFGVRYRHGNYQTTESDTVNKFLPAFHISVLGVRLGRTFGFFGELGVGYKGILVVGFNGQF
jgi:hypothetical protein